MVATVSWLTQCVCIGVREKEMCVKREGINVCVCMIVSRESEEEVCVCVPLPQA